MSEYEDRMNSRTIADAMRSLFQLREDFGYIVQPDVSCYDRMLLLEYISEMRAAINGIIGVLNCSEPGAVRACRNCFNCRKQLYLLELLQRVDNPSGA